MTTTYIPPPFYLSEKATMRSTYRNKNLHAEKYISLREEDDILDKVFIPHLTTNGYITYFYVGWYTSARQEVYYYYNLYMNSIKKEKMRKKLRTLFKLTVIMLKCHHESNDCMYRPDSVFVKTVLKNSFTSIYFKIKKI